ncbi:MAG: hydantoinase B/oxoprolinase family protein, partial [Pseudomonadota bacterium]
DRAGLDELHQQFQTLHLQRFGYVMDKPDLVAATVAVELSAFHEFDKDIQFKIPRSTRDDLPDQGFASIYMDGEYQPSMVLHRDQMEAGQIIQGPAILCESGSATIVEPGWQVQKLTGGELLLTRHQPKVRNQTIGTDCDPVMLEVFNNLFMSIAEQMGFTLQNTAHSVNIKERLDFSCALFDAKGNLVANAPHMPVHLGSMGESVRAVLSQGREHLRPGDVYALNVPWRGGTHLPDLTVLTPVFDPSGKEILFFTASRGHHSDVGGITPGSMPSFSTHIEEEGILLDNFLLVSQGQFCEQPLREVLAAGPYPARNPDQNIADLQAQIAANAKGVQELDRMISHYGLATVQAYMQHVQDNAEAAVRAVISRLDDGEYCYAMDHGAHVRVKVAIDRKRQEAIVDFTGTSPQQANNFNAPSSVCRAAVLYVFRCLVDEAIPMNEGCLKPIKLIIEPASMLAPEYPAAVVAGNVETSQTITDCLFAALKVMGAAQGTMNNLTFGNQRVQYYETICGGAGAGPGFHGADAVHTHMTNSRLTDPEILEMRFPVILQTFEIMHGSGGRGRWCGGAGVRRQLRFLETVECSLLANRHIIAPYGMAGGHDGRPGRARIIRANGTVEVLASCASTVLHAGDVLDLETPSGGGFGTMPASAGAAGKS